MTFKLSKTAVRELTRFYRAILMGVIISGFISVSASATVSIDDGAGGTATVYTEGEVNNLLANIGTDQIVDGSVNTNDLANNAVTADKIADDAIGQNHIANASVGTDELIDKSVTINKLDETLQANINQIGTNTNAIATLNGDANTTGSVANTVNVAVKELADGAVKNNADAIAQNAANIAANKNAIEVLSGNAATEGSVAKTVADAVSTKQDKLSDAQMNAVNSGITADKVVKYEAYGAEIDAKANAADVYTKETVDAKLDNKADKTTVATNAANIASNTAAIAQNVADINANETAISQNAADIAALEAGKANATDVYTKTEINTQVADAKAYADTQDAATLVAAQTYADGKATAAETNAKSYTDTQVADAKAYADTQDAATLAAAQTYAEEKANTAEANAKSYTDTLIGTTDVLVEQNGVMAVNTVNENIAALNNTIGDITDLNQYVEGSSIGNALTQGGTQSADTIVAALNNVDATLGTIHGLRDKLAASGAGTNLASGTTVEQHLTALDSAIGNRAYTSTRYISSGSDLSTAVSALDSNLSRVEGNLDALTTRTNKMHHEMKSGFASLAAMSALVPNARVAGDTQISVGAGHYRGTTGFALGAFHHVNDNVLLNAGAAYGGNGSATFKGGVTFGW